MLTNAVLGLDIGGANLKAVLWPGIARSQPFPLWKAPGDLPDALRKLLAGWNVSGPWAVTMTGELADCFQTKADGVRHIVQSVRQMAPAEVGFWGTDGRFHTPAECDALPLVVASANWHVQATWVARSVLPDGWLIDIGSTTTDIIRLHQGRPATTGHTDIARLSAGELVYSGVNRTPLCALAQSIPFRGEMCPIAAELFATTQDLYLLQGDVAENPHDHATANGGPATRAAARARLARMLCCDESEVSPDEIDELARSFSARQQTHIIESWDRAASRGISTSPDCVVSGSGAFLAERLAKSRGLSVVNLSDRLGPALAEAACAWSAVACSVREQ